MTRHHFSGFPADLRAFLSELSRHNNRSWFKKNQDRYEASVREPSLEFIAAMAGPLKRISPQFVALPKKVGGSLMRIHRDVRFSKNKQPYKTNVGIQFRHAAGKDVHAPGFYFHIDPYEVFLGVGIWHPCSPTLRTIRQAIVDDPAGWKRVSRGKAFLSEYELAGDSLQRPPQGIAKDHPLLEDLKRKDHIAACRLEHDELLHPGIVDQTAATFAKAKAYMKFLCTAVGVPF